MFFFMFMGFISLLVFRLPVGGVPIRDAHPAAEHCQDQPASAPDV